MAATGKQMECLCLSLWYLWWWSLILSLTVLLLDKTGFSLDKPIAFLSNDSPCHSNGFLIVAVLPSFHGGTCKNSFSLPICKQSLWLLLIRLYHHFTFTTWLHLWNVFFFFFLIAHNFFHLSSSVYLWCFRYHKLAIRQLCLSSFQSLWDQWMVHVLIFN